MNVNVATFQGTKIHNNSSNNSHYKLFDLTQGVCKYENLVTVFERQPSLEYSNTIQITNKAYTSDDGNIQKYVSIRFKDRQIIVKDVYQFQKNQQSLFDKKKQDNLHRIQQRRLHLFRHNQISSQTRTCGKKITKNLAKNFIRAFSKYLRESHEAKKRLDQGKLKIFRKKINYNNAFVQEIIHDQQICQFFEKFLDTFALEWIQNSKIVDKQSHYETIRILKNLISKTKNKTQKKTNRISQEKNHAPGSIDIEYEVQHFNLNEVCQKKYPPQQLKSQNESQKNTVSAQQLIK